MKNEEFRINRQTSEIHKYDSSANAYLYYGNTLQFSERELNAMRRGTYVECSEIDYDDDDDN